MRSFCLSLLKCAKDKDSELAYFARLFDDNIEQFQITRLNKAIQILRKNYMEFSSKGDHNFKRLKLKIKDIIKFLGQIFSNHMLS